MRRHGLSVNAIFVQMASKVDQCEIKRLAESIGVHNANGQPLSSRPSCAIGGCENNIAPVTAAAAFARSRTRASTVPRPSSTASSTATAT
jgi:hypothetical protein